MKKTKSGKRAKKSPSKTGNRIIDGTIEGSVDNFKEGLLEVNNVEDRYDNIFQDKLEEQYRAFREMKEHGMQIRKLIRILAVIMIIAILTLLLLTYTT